VLDSEVVLPVVRQALVERAVLFRSDIIRVTSPDRLRLVQLLVLNSLLLDLLGLFLLLFVLNLFDLRLVTIFFLLLDFVILNLLYERD
jgi:hypothetical protein